MHECYYVAHLPIPEYLGNKLAYTLRSSLVCQSRVITMPWTPLQRPCGSTRQQRFTNFDLYYLYRSIAAIHGSTALDQEFHGVYTNKRVSDSSFTVDIFYVCDVHIHQNNISHEHIYLSSHFYLMQPHNVCFTAVDSSVNNWCYLRIYNTLQVPLEVETSFTLKPKDGVYVKYEPRKWSTQFETMQCMVQQQVSHFMQILYSI